MSFPMAGNRVWIKPIYDQVSPERPECETGSCVRYLHVSEIPEKYSMGVFVFAPYSKIPLHDHPGMCVLSRVLYGEIKRLSLDLVPQGHQPTRSLFSMFGMGRRAPLNAKRAQKRGVDHLVAPAVTTLYPYEGNLHEFVAGPEGAAVLDVLLPPYDGVRDCTFYDVQDIDYSDSCWIVPTGQPEDFHCLSGCYGSLGADRFFAT